MDLTVEKSVTGDLYKNSVRGVMEVKSLLRVGLKENGTRGIRYGEHRPAFSIVWLCSQCLAEFLAYI